MNNENLIQYFKVEKLQLDKRKTCFSFFEKLVDKKNILCLWQLSKIFSHKLLRKNFVSLIKHNFVSLSKANEMKLIDYSLFRFLISRSDLNVSSELEVFEATVG